MAPLRCLMLSTDRYPKWDPILYIKFCLGESNSVNPKTPYVFKNKHLALMFIGFLALKYTTSYIN